ncbi:hypothetical protein MNBD_PLANCTO02-1921 [hydrothermal vent metagenome]|uniref:Uncharacterized protein n=1 Tax=hydrothermal vent metagenome TaxID=652676 RepID=A0A3B1DVP0_9ZZZZ
MQEPHEKTEAPVEEISSQEGLSLRRKTMLVIAIICIVILSVVIYQECNQPNKTDVLDKRNAVNTVPVKQDIGKKNKTKEEQFDLECRKKSVGTWEKEESGKRTLTIKENGTATLIYLPSGVNRFLLGEKVIVKIKWIIQKGKVKFRSHSGLPEKSFNIITATHGREKIRKILEISDKHFMLYDEKEKEKSKWTRVAQKG